MLGHLTRHLVHQRVKLEVRNPVRLKDGLHDHNGSSSSGAVALWFAGTLWRDHDLFCRCSLSSQLDAGSCGFVCPTGRDETVVRDSGGKSCRDFERSGSIPGGDPWKSGLGDCRSNRCDGPGMEACTVSEDTSLGTLGPITSFHRTPLGCRIWPT